MFTEQELAKMALADREIEAGFHLDMEDMAVSKELDRVAKLGYPRSALILQILQAWVKQNYKQ